MFRILTKRVVFFVQTAIILLACELLPHSAAWIVASNGDGKRDILWREAGGSNAIWFMNGATVSSVALIGGVGNTWAVQNAGAN